MLTNYTNFESKKYKYKISLYESKEEALLLIRKYSKYYTNDFGIFIGDINNTKQMKIKKIFFKKSNK